MNQRFCLFVVFIWFSATAYAAAPLSFADDIQPILERSCLPCHNATKAEGELQLETPKLMEKGGESGSGLVPNHSMESLVYLSAAHLKKPFMPPEGNKSKAAPLTSLQVEILRRWIDEGALGNPKPRQAIAWKNMPGLVQTVSAVALTPGAQFAACARGNEVTIYHVPLQRPSATFRPHPDVVSALAFSPDGNILATGSHGEVKLWRKAPSAVPPFPALVPAVDRAALNAEIPELAKATVVQPVQCGTDALIVSAGAENKVTIWNRATKKALQTIAIDGAVTQFAPALDGKIVALVIDGKPVRLVSLPDGKPVANLKCDFETTEQVAVADLNAAGAAFELGFLQGELKAAQARIGTLGEDLKKAEKERADLAAKRGELEKAKTDAATKRDSLSKPRDEAEDAAMAAGTALDAAKKSEAEALKLTADAAAKRDKAAAEAKAAAVKTADDAKAAAAKATEARTAAEKALNASSEKQKKTKTEFEEAMKALIESSGELQRADAAEATVKNLTEALAALHVDEKALQAALAAAQKINDDLTKALASAREQADKHLLPPVKAVAFVAEPPVLLTAHADNSVRAWHPATGAPLKADNLAAKWVLLRTIGDAAKVDSVLTDRVNALAFSPDGKLLATGSGEPSRSGELKLWDAQTGQLVREIAKAHKDSVLALDFSSDGKLLASGAADRAVRIWNVAAGSLVRSLEAHSNHVLAVSFRYDIRRLASASADNSVKVWDLKTADVLKTFADFSKEVNGLRYLGHGDQLLACSGAPVVRILKDAGGDVRSKTDGFPRFISASAVSRDGQIQAVGDAAGTLRILNFEGKILAQWPPSAVFQSKN